jgi:hypothetical protein
LLLDVILNYETIELRYDRRALVGDNNVGNARRLILFIVDLDGADECKEVVLGVELHRVLYLFFQDHQLVLLVWVLIFEIRRQYLYLLLRIQYR